MTTGLNPQKITYNGYTFPLSSAAIVASTQYDSIDSTLQSTKYTVKIKAWITEKTPENLTAQIKAFSVAVNQSRKRFVWMMGTTTLYDISGPGGGGSTLDVKNGPHPRGFVVKKIYNGISAEIEGEIEFNGESSENGIVGQIMEFWWAFRFTQDQRFSTTRVITGQVRIASSGANIDSLITNDSSFWPKLPSSFEFMGAERNVSADGLVISFVVTHRQVWRTLPQPFTDGQLTFSLNQVGAILTKTLSGHISAPFNINKAVIIQFLVVLIRNYFPLAFDQTDPTQPNQVPASPKEMFTSFNIIEHPLDNRLDFSATTRTSAQNILKSPLDQLFPDIANINPQSSDNWTKSNGQSMLLGNAGTSGLLATPIPPFNAVDGPGGNPPAQGITGPDAGNPGYDNTTNGSNQVPPALNPGNISDAQLTYPYTLYLETYMYVLDRGLRQINATGTGTNLVQQTSQPRSRILVTGRARRLGTPPDAPVPPPTLAGTPSPVFINMEISYADSPQPNSDGSLEFAAKWTYEVLQPQGNSATNTTLSDIIIPNNPQLSPASVKAYQNPATATPPGLPYNPAPQPKNPTGQFTQTAP